MATSSPQQPKSSMATSSPGSEAVPSIMKLDEAVVNRIAAGEVVHRPASAVKEMMENSLDAGSTSITIVLKDGGLKMLQITDDGHGIRKSDLGIVCERFTTSKLRQFNDLDHIQTYGFRGEALASITHVAHVTIMTKTAGSSNAWKAKYSDGKLVPLQPGRKAGPMPCAGVKGTQITVNDMFYNVATRRKALKSASEEFKRVLEVVSRYAIHFGSRGVSFTCKKYGQGLPALHTLKGNSTLQNISAVYGSQLAQELVPFEAAENWGTRSDKEIEAGPAQGSNDTDDDKFSYSAKGFISNANFNRATGIFLLFINDRLVQSAKLKRAFDNVYSEYLPRKRHAFVYLSVTLPSHHCDVNVHPTKNQVHFLHEELLIDKLQQALSGKLRGANQSRTYRTQALLPTVIGSNQTKHDDDYGSDDDLGTQHPGAEALRGRYLEASPGSEDSNTTGPSDHSASSSTPSSSSTSTRSTRSSARGSDAQKKKRPAPNPSRMVRTDSRVTLVNSYFRPLSETQIAATGSDDEFGSGASGPSSTSGQASSAASRILQRRKRRHAGCNGCPDCADGSQDGAGGGSKAYAAVAAVDWRKAAAATSRLDSESGGAAASASQPPRQRRRMPSKEVPYPPIMLTSVENLLKHIAKRGNAALRKVIAEHVYIGAVDEELALLQFNTKMYLVNHWEMSKEYFYQRAIRNFSHFPRIVLQPPASLTRLLEVAFATAEIHNPTGDDSVNADASTSDDSEAQKAKQASQIKEAVELLVSKADMLDEYFQISITPAGLVESLPQLEPEVEYTPQLDGLPRFM
eukprot:INCI5135.20.p1 GENE.INCI5135.20~~INCI5135.20.p1  ORF type:complete len:800 (-),score=149.93 INCI5135.20:132-2531(-)